MLMRMNESLGGIVDVSPADAERFAAAGWTPVDGAADATDGGEQAAAPKAKRRTTAKKTAAKAE